MEGLIFKTLSE